MTIHHNFQVSFAIYIWHSIILGVLPGNKGNQVTEKINSKNYIPESNQKFGMGSVRVQTISHG